MFTQEIGTRRSVGKITLKLCVGEPWKPSGATELPKTRRTSHGTPQIRANTVGQSILDTYCRTPGYGQEWDRTRTWRERIDTFLVNLERERPSGQSEGKKPKSKGEAAESGGDL